MTENTEYKGLENMEFGDANAVEQAGYKAMEQEMEIVSQVTKFARFVVNEQFEKSRVSIHDMTRNIGDAIVINFEITIQPG